jgi:predicted hydrocarbon binding protein
MQEEGNMPWKVERFVGCLKPYAGQDEITRLIEGCGEFHPSNPPNKAKFAKCLMDNFEKRFPEEVRAKVMEDCGRSCIGYTTIERARRIKRNSKTLDDLVNGLNERHIVGGKISLENNKIYAVYNRCYCSMVNKTKERFSSTYCNCGRGWFLELFEKIFERPVKVDLVESIIQGAKTCKFAIQP